MNTRLKFKYLTKSPGQTKKLGEFLARKILRIPPQKTAIVIGLEGNLGGGKTTFLQGFAKGLGIKEKILSPTFIIMRKSKIQKQPFGVVPSAATKSKYGNFYHIDCYRVEKSKEIIDLGFKEIVKSSQNVVAVEWAEKIRKILPKKIIWVKFEFVDKNKRKILIKGSQTHFCFNLWKEKN